MTDRHEPPLSQVADSPPLTPPESDPNESSSRPSRKREREVSLEPANTPQVMDDSDVPTGTEPRDARSSAKRNKRALETTREETIEDGISKPCSLRSRSRSHSVSPPIGVAVSPGQEIRIRVRQISQGVEDLNWKTLKASEKKDEQVTEIKARPALTPPLEIAQEISEDTDVVITDVKDGDSQEVEPQGATNNVTADNGTKDATDKDDMDKSRDTALTAAMTSTAQTHARNRSEEGSKRPSEERTNQRSDEEENATKTAPEPLKRPRDEEDEDPNPRETKRPSPPPEARRLSPPPEKQKPSSKPKSPSSKPSPKLTGFMAYANTSPFAAVKGPNLFASGKSSPPSTFANSSSSTTLSSLASTSSELSSSPPKNLKRSGFEAFASSSSPFAAAARSKSPVLGQTSKLGRAKSPSGRSNSINSNPFASYLGTTQGFVVPAQKRARADSPPESSHSSQERYSTLHVLERNRPQSPEDEGVRDAAFGEKLRATRDDDNDSNRSDEDSKPVLTEKEVITGEEDDRTIHQVRAKLFSLEDSQWKERGTGLIRLNVRRSGGNSARLVMRKDAVYTLLLNVTLFPGMLARLADQDSRYLRFSAIENGATTHYNLRLGSSKAAQDLLAKILSNVPEA